MELDRNLLKEFAQITNDSEDKPQNTYLRGTIIKNSGGKYVQLDGSTTATPISEVVDVEEGDRVLVSIENHKATIIGNFSFPPSARKEQEALDQAGEAQDTANNANDKAQSASNKADTAISQSSIASASAAEAKQQANDAITAANTASTNANEAKTLATQASTDASDAKSQAASSQAASAEAQAEVTRLQGEVNNAKEDASKALEDLQTQADEIESIKETYATKVEVGNTKAELETTITTKVGELETTVSQTYSTKTENVELEGRLQSQITQNANNISSQVSKIETLESDTEQAKKDVDDALSKANAAQSAADNAQTTADNAQAAANAAQANADTATEKANTAQNAADAAQAAANAADKAVQSAQSDLNEAKQNLANVTSRVDATEEDIADAQAKVDKAQTDVNTALANAAEANLAATKAQEAADKAQTDAETAQGAANTAQQKADNAQTAATNAQTAADKAQADVAALTSRVTTAETNISQNSDNITLNANKITEIGEQADATDTNLANNYYNKTETDAKIKVESDRITSTVTKVETVEKSAITSSVEEFYLSSSPTALSGGSWSNTQPTWTEGKYIWRRTLVTKGDGTTSYQPSQNGVCITGNTGAKGNDGAAGKGISSITNYYLTADKAPGKYVNIEWDGDTTGLEAMLMDTGTSSMTLGFYKVSDEILSIDDLNSACIIKAYDSSEGEMIDNINYYESFGENNEIIEVGIDDEPLIYIFKQSFTDNGVTYSPGIYFYKYNYTYSGGVMYMYVSQFCTPNWSTEPINTDSVNKHLYTYQVIEYTDGSTTTTDPIMIGTYGDTGKGIETILNEYQTHSDGVTTPTGEWSTTIPQTTAENPYLWVKLTTTYTDGTTSVAYTVGATPEGVLDEVDTAITNVETAFYDRLNDVNTSIETAQSTINQLSNMISHLVTDANGESLMTQTSDGWTFNMSSINGNLEAVKDALVDMENDQNNTNDLLQNLTDLVNDVTKKTAYITMSMDDNGDPCIELGKSDNEFKVRITNTAIDFLEGSTKIAYANNNTFYSTKIIVKELQIGEGPGFVWKTRENGNCGLTYIEG